MLTAQTHTTHTLTHTLLTTGATPSGQGGHLHPNCQEKRQKLSFTFYFLALIMHRNVTVLRFIDGTRLKVETHHSSTVQY